MTKKSLSTSIFGESKDNEGGLSSLFGASASALPAMPNNVDFPETTTERAKREKKEEKRKKRKTREEKEAEKELIKLPPSQKVKSEKKKKERKPKTEAKEEEKDDEIEEKGEPSDEDRTIFVGNLPLDINRKRLESLFRECGKIKSSRLRSFGTTGVKVAPEHAGNQDLVKKISVNTKQLLKGAKSTAQGYVVFKSMESVDAALKLNNTPSYDGLLLRVDRATPTRDSTRSVFVGNLPYKTNEMTLRSHFCEGCGWDVDEDVVEGVRIVRDKETMQCKGFGYVLLKDKSYVPAALNMHESTYMKKELRVLVCGKRFKGRKGAPKEGVVQKTGAHRRVANKNKDRESSGRDMDMNDAKELITGSKDKKKRGTKKIAAHKSGVGGLSKRAASGKKVDKRVKKIQKRMQKGMGSSKR